MQKMDVTFKDLTLEDVRAISELLAGRRNGKTTAEAPAAPTTMGDVGDELDDRGVPHNPQFHAPGKGKTKAGAWARKKGVDVAAADAYEAQFKTSAPAHTAPAAPGLPGLPPAMTLPHPGPSYPPVDFNTFVGLYSPMASSGMISGDDVTRIMAEVGIGDINEFQTNDRARAHAFGLLSVIKAGTKK